MGASTTDSDISLHQATGGSKRKQTADEDSTDSDDDEAFMESIKTELFCSLRKKNKTSSVREKLLLPAGFLAPLSPVSRPSPMEMEQDQQVVAEPDAPPRTCDLLRRDTRVRHFTNKPKRRRRNNSQSKGKNIIRTTSSTHTAEINYVDAQQKVTVNVDPPNCHNSTTVLQRAINLQSSLKPGLMSFLKPIPLSSVTGDDIRLTLPASFCKKHLPDEDATVILEDVNCDRYETKYSSSRGKLGLGWRKFCKAHKLVQGDVLVFQQINQTNFKVYIVRSNLSAEVDAAKSASSGAEKNLVTDDDDDLVEFEFDSCDDSVSNSIESTTSAVDFKNVRSIEDFVIMIDGSVLNNDESEIPINIKTKYYDLCRSQRQYLHQNLFKGLNRKLAAGIITEVVNIADAVKANSKMSSEIISEWVKTLSGFKNMGMEVGFLLDWVQKLKEVDEKSEMEIKKARMKRNGAEKEKIELEAKLKVISEALDQYNGEVKELEKMREFMLRQLGNVPW